MKFLNKIGLFLFLFWVFVACVSPALFSEEALRLNLNKEYAAPEWPQILGYGESGVSLLAAIALGATQSLKIAFISVFIAAFLGLIFGVFLAFCGGRIDFYLSKFLEAFLIFPSFILFVSAAVFWGGGFWALILALVLSSWAAYARFVRLLVLKIKEEPHVESYLSLGGYKSKILSKHILPFIWGPFWVQICYGLEIAIVFESSLSFLGLGTDPGTFSWGVLLSQARSAFLMAPHVLFFPCIALFSLLLGVHLMGDGLSSLFEQKTKL